MDWLRQRLAAPVFAGEPDKTRVARLLNAVLWSFVAALLAYLVASFFLPNPESSLPIVSTAILLALAAWFLMRRGRVRIAGVLLTSTVWTGLTLVAIFFGGFDGPAAFGYVLIVIVAAIVLEGRYIFLFAGASVAAGLALLWAGSNNLLPEPAGPNPLVAWWAALSLYIVLAAALLRVATRSLDEALDQARGYAAELEQERASLEGAVAERTHQLARRARYLEATATVARDAAQELDIGELLSRVVQSISEHFGLYHAGIFFLDPAGEWLVLQAASSQGGQQMLARGHRLRIGEGIVGYAAQHRQYRLALDVGEDAVFFDNPDLPETRSEMALALQARAEVIGVLDVQSTEARAFSDEDVAALEALADQVALALSNARLFWEAQQALEAERKAYGEIGREAWQRVLHARPNLGYRYTERSVLPVGQADGEAAPRGRGDGNGEEMGGLSLPIRHLGQKLGTIVAHKPADAGDWTSQETELMEMLAEQLSLALDSARLYQETQRRAVQERLVGEATARMRETLDIETVLRTTASEMRRALDLDNLVIRLATPETDGAPSGDAEAE